MLNVWFPQTRKKAIVKWYGQWWAPGIQQVECEDANMLDMLHELESDAMPTEEAVLLSIG